MRHQTRIASAILVVTLAGCGGGDPSASPESSVAIATPSGPDATAAGSASPGGTAGPTGTTTSGAVAVDPSLLDVLPAAVDAAERRPDAETAAEIAASADLVSSVASLAVALYVGPGAEGAEDLAIASVAQLRPSVYSDAWFRSWRDSYDGAACEPAGGRTTGSAEVEIGGRATFIGTCQNGVHTYHVHLRDLARVVSITSVGEGRYGERIVAGLEE